MLLPPDMDEESKYPLLVYVYGGPGSQVGVVRDEERVIDKYSDGVR